MFRIAKSIDTSNEEVDFQIVNVTTGHFDTKENKFIYNKLNVLEITIHGNIDKDEYCLHFLILKPISEYENIKKYEEIVIKENQIEDSYIEVNRKADLGLKIKLKVLRFNESLIFSLMFRNDDEDIFGTSEVELELNKLQM